MAMYDSADLLARCKMMAQRPQQDESTSDADWFLLLTQAQQEVNEEMAAHVPWENYGEPELMTTTDSGLTYTVANEPLGHLEVYPAKGNEPLLPGAYWDYSSDFTVENGGKTIRWVGNRARTSWTDGAPYARYVAPTSTIDASTPPTLKPTRARILIVYRALALWASRGGFRDPSYYRSLEQIAMWGDPNNPGSVGLIPGMKASFMATGDGWNTKWWQPFLGAS